ncbi:MAG: amino acid permease [Candidatus Nanopelagicaceae bacterium]|nr:amino acid permease [Candidatus Nanopelagicaceae bacterium]
MAKSWTDGAPAPVALKDHAHVNDPLSYKIKKRMLGGPLNRHTLSHQRLKKRYALGILSSDCISSSAYGSEQILIALLPAFGLAAFTLLMPLTFVVLIILTIITLSYTNVIDVYTKTGGAYIVSRDNFGPTTSIIAAVALMLDYIVTLAVQASAGVLAIISTFPNLEPYKVEMVLFVIAFLTYGNLRGVKEAGKAFAAPTYLFIIGMYVVFIVGIYKVFNGSLEQLSTNQEGAVSIGTEQGLLSAAAIFILLRAFANGGSSLTGLEAISDGVALFEVPEAKNAKKTLIIMSILLGSLVLGVSWFAHKLYALPYESGSPTVISQIAKSVMGDGPFGNFWYIYVQFATTLILFAGANTTYSAFPILCNFVATDGFLPKQLTKRGHRLAFSNGIIFLAVGAVIFVVTTGASVEHLVAFYALGVFTGFTLAGFGMARHAKRNKTDKWRTKYVINTIAGSVSLTVVIIFSIVKFTEGAWIILLIAPIAVVSLVRLNRRYVREQAVLSLAQERTRATSIARHDVTVLVDNVDLATVGAVRYARSLNPHTLKAVHFVIDDRRADDIQKAWAVTPALSDVSLELIDCPDRRLANAALDYSIRATADGNHELTLLLPRRSYSRVLGRILHDQTAEQIASPISQLPRVVATIIPFDVAKLLDGGTLDVQEQADEKEKVSTATVAEPSKRMVPPANLEPVSHYSEKVIKIGEVIWRKRAHVQGRVTAIRTSPANQAPMLEVEMWDETGGITLQFLGRRSLAGLDVGSQLRAEGMVGEIDGLLTILNPNYELLH